MPIVKNAATTLAQGVSQQAESQRYSSQATEQINGYSSTIKGLTKRPPTKFINKITVDSGTAFAHTINRDASEQYVVVVNPYSTIVINSYAAGSDSINIASVLAVGDRIRFSKLEDNSTLPRGLIAGSDYYVKTVAASGSTFNITVSRTKGGVLQKIGKASIDKITIESVRATDKRWIDGVYSVKFDTGHGLVAGDIVRIEGLTANSNAEKILDVNKDYILRVPTKWFDYYEYSSGSYTASAWPTDCFLLGETGDSVDLQSDNLGYVVDTRWEDAGDDDGYLMMGSGNIHWVPLKQGVTTVGTGEAVASVGKSITLYSNASDAGNWPTVGGVQWQHTDLIGSFVRLGGRQELDKAIRARVVAASNTNRTVTLDRYVDFEDFYFDSDKFNTGSCGTSPGTYTTRASCEGAGHTWTAINPPTALSNYNDDVAPFSQANPKWFFLCFWADTTTTAKIANGGNPRWIDPTEVANAYVGSNDDSGSFRIEKGGMHVFDADTGAEYALNAEQGFDYLNYGNNPQQNLRAVTIADYTFMVNTSVATKPVDEVKYQKSYEAFITTRTADYGKTYKVKVGDKHSPSETVVIDGGTTDMVTVTAAYTGGAASGQSLTVEALPVPLSTGGKITFTNGVVATLGASVVKGATTIGSLTITGNIPINTSGTPDNPALNATAAKAYVDIMGENAQGKKGVWACRIQAKTEDPKYNGYQIRLIQNWKWNKSNYPLHANAKNNVRNGTDMLPAYSLKYKGANVGSYHYYSDKVAIYKTGKEMIIYVNFPWANKESVRNKATTCQDLIDAFRTLAVVKTEWEVVMLTGTDFQTTTTDSAGNISKPKFTTAVLADDNTSAAHYKFSHLIVGAQGIWVSGSYAPDHSSGSRDIEYRYLLGRDEPRNVQYYQEGGKVHATGSLTAGFRSPNTKAFVRNFFTSKGGRVEGGWQWESTSATDVRVVETGEYWYKTPKWTGSDKQQTIGTERIAEMLASDAKISEGYWGVDGTQFHKANGRLVQSKPDGAHADFSTNAAQEREAYLGKESCLGMTYRPPGEGYLWDVNSKEIVGKNKSDIPHQSNWRVQQQGYTIALAAPDRDLFNITVEDDLGGQGLKLTFFEASETQDLPHVCRHGHVVKIVGDAREEADDYYLRFEADDPNNTDGLQQGRWVECVGYEARYKFDQTTMPVALVREFVGSTPTFRLEHVAWDERAAGDDKSNPFPSFSGNTINDIFLYRNRLGFLSGENVICSEAGEYYNFFRTTTAALLDTAPIDVQASTNKVSTLRSAVPYHEKLVLFSDQTQFILDGEPFLSPKTVQLTPANEVDSIPTVTPIVTGGSLYFPFKRAGYSGIGELTPSQVEADVLDVADSTAHVPKYIVGNITKLAAATNEDVVCAITDTVTEAVLYVYKYFKNTQGQKVQSAYFKYVFGVANDYIHDITFIGNTLYMVIKRGSSHYIESLRFEDDQKDVKTSGSMDFQVLLDHRTDTPPAADITAGAVTLPANYKVTSTMKLVDEDGNQYGPSTTTGSNVFSCAVPTTKKFYIGEPYTLEYTFSQPFLKREKTTETGRYQLQRAHLEFANSRYFEVDVIHNPTMSAPNRITVTNKFESSQIQDALVSGTADLYSGFFKFSIQERNDRLQLKLRNATPYPSDLLSIDYVSRVFSHASRWRS